MASSSYFSKSYHSRRSNLDEFLNSNSSNGVSRDIIHHGANSPFSRLGTSKSSRVDARDLLSTPEPAIGSGNTVDSGAAYVPGTHGDQVDQLVALVKQLKQVDIDSVEASLQELSSRQSGLVRQKEEELQCARQKQEEECAALESTRQTQKKEFFALKESYDDMLQKYEAEVTKNDDIRERAEKQIRDLRSRTQDDQEDRERQLRRQIKDRDEEIRDLKDSNRRELEQKKQEINRLRAELKEKEHDITFGHSDRNLAGSNTRALEQQEEQLRRTTMQLREKEVEITTLKVEKDSALSRLSKEMGDKLSANNPGLADLSDPNRSTKVAELYGSVYDNEWTDALECLTHQGTDEETGVRFLLEIMKHIYSFCTKAKEELMQELQGRLSNPVSRGTYTDEGMSSPEDKQIRQMLDGCVKMKVKTAISNLNKSYSQMKSSSKPRYADRLPEYVNKCVEICWLMNTQSPSLIFAEPLPSGQTIDKDQYKEYTKQGDVVSFVVWLPLLIEQDGAVLSKGVVQPVPRIKSERRKSSKSESVKSRSHHETQDKRFKEVVDEVSRDQRERNIYDSSGEIGRDYGSRTRDRDLYNNDISGNRLHVDRYTATSTGSRLSPTPSANSVDELFQDSRFRTYTKNTSISTPPLSRSHSPNISSAPYRSEYSHSPTVPSHTTSKNYYSDKTTTSRVTERPTSGYTSHHKTAADYGNERSKTVGGTRPESGKNTVSYIDHSEIFAVGGHNYTLHKGRLYKQNHAGEWQFSRELGDS